MKIIPDHPRISISNEIMNGKPCIHGTRVMVETIVLMAKTDSDSAIVRQYPFLKVEDIKAALAFAKSQF